MTFLLPTGIKGLNLTGNIFHDADRKSDERYIFENDLYKAKYTNKNYATTTATTKCYISCEN